MLKWYIAKRYFPDLMGRYQAPSCEATRKCALLNSIAALFRRSVSRCGKVDAMKLRAGLCCKTGEISRRMAATFDDRPCIRYIAKKGF